MSSNNAAVEAALLEIAKDLLQASDDLAATDPSSSAKFAHEAYEIGRDLGLVRSDLDAYLTAETAVPPKNGAPTNGLAMNGAHINGANGAGANGGSAGYADATSHKFAADDGLPIRPRLGDPDDEEDEDLLRILDRQREVVPSFADLAPSRRPSSRGKKDEPLDVDEPRRSGWFSWMRSRDLGHVG